MTRARVAAAALVLLAAAPALAFVRSEARDAQDHLIGGRCLRWQQSGLTFVLNATKVNGVGCSQAAAEALARASLGAWNDAATTPGDVCGFAFGGGDTTASTVTGRDDQNLIVWRRGLCDRVAPAGDSCRAVPGACADKYNCWPYSDVDTIALTTATYLVSTGELLDVDMELHDRDEVPGTGHWFTCSGGPRICPIDATGKPTRPDGSCIGIDLGGTITHEGGHMLGLAHPCEPAPGDARVRRCQAPDTSQNVTMFPTSPAGDTSKRTLKDDDVAGVCTIYPRGGPAQATGGLGQSGTACASPPAATKASGGCSTTGPGDAALLFVLTALARRRSRTVK